MNCWLCEVVAMRFILNPDAEEFIPKAEEHRHGRERYGYNLGRGQAGQRVVKQIPRQRGRACRDWGGLGRLNPAIGNQGMHRAGKRRAYIAIEPKIQIKDKKDGGVGPRVGWQGLLHARPE